MTAVTWYNTEKTVIHWEIGTQMSVLDYQQAVAQTFNMMQSVLQRVDVIVDASQLRDLPSGLMGQILLAHTQMNHLHNQGHIIIISNNHFLQAIYQTLDNVPNISGRVTFSSTLADALERLSLSA